MFRKLLIKIGLDPKQVKSISAITIGNISTQAFRFLFWLVVIWILTPDEYGYVRYSLTIANFLSLPVVSGFASAITKFISEHVKNRKLAELYAFQTVFLDFTMMFIVVISSIFLGFFTSGGIPMLSAYIVGILGLYTIYYSYSRGLMDVRRIVLFGVSVNITRAGFVVLLYLVGLYGIFWAMTAYGLPIIVGVIVGEIFKTTELRLHISPIDIQTWKKISVFAIPGLLSAGMWMFIGKIDIIFIGMYFGLEDVAYYSLAKTLSSLLGFVTGAVIVLQMPKVSSFGRNKKRIYEYTKKTMKLSVAGALSLAFILYLTAPFLLSVFFPPEYMQSLYLLYIIIPGTLFGGLFAVLGATWIGYGKPEEEAKVLFYGVLSMLFLSILLMSWIGIYGIPISFTLSEMLVFVLMYFKTKKYFK